MSDDIHNSLPAGDELALAADDTELLEAGDESALPEEDYAVISDPSVLNQEAQDAEKLGEAIVATQNIISRYSDQFDALREKIKIFREQLKNIFDNDAELQEMEAQAKTATTDLKAKKQRVKESPEAVALQMKLKEVQEEEKEIIDTLNGHLLRYYQMTGSKVIEEADGSEREFTVSARLKSKKAGIDPKHDE